MTGIRTRSWEVDSIRTRLEKRFAHRLNERGVVIIWASLMLTMLMGFAGFSVDVGHWYLKTQRAQRASDAAALAAAPYLPQNPTAARNVAVTTLRENGVEEQYITQALNNNWIRPVTSSPSQMYVRVPTQVQNTFLRFLGVSPTSNFTRAATATWRPPIEMANVSNVLGAEPDGLGHWQTAAKLALQREWWLSVAGPQTYQGRGDENTGARCGVAIAPAAPVPAGCSHSGATSSSYIPPPAGGQFHDAQYTYTVRVARGAPPQPLYLQVYDPAFALTGPYCRDVPENGLYFWGGGYMDRLQARTGWANHAPGNMDYCAGDHQYLDNHYSWNLPYPMPDTYFRVYRADGSTIPQCPVQGFQPWGPTNFGLNYRNQPGLEQYAYNGSFQSVFHQWVNLCNGALSIDNSKETEYKIQVWTSGHGEGINHFSIRAGIGSSVNNIDVNNSSAYIKVSADDRLPLFTNFQGSNMRFAIAEVPMSWAGSQLEFTGFDFGDCYTCTVHNPATFQLSSDSVSASSAGGSSTRSCYYTPVGSGSLHTLGNCTLGGVSYENYNGRKLTFVWNIPNDYRCGYAVNGTSCVLYMNASWPASGLVDDISTWSLKSDGIPIRLIPNPASP